MVNDGLGVGRVTLCILQVLVYDIIMQVAKVSQALQALFSRGEDTLHH